MKRALAVVGAAGLALAGCAVQPPPEGELGGTVTVFAAASLTDTFGAMADAFERQHPDVTIVASFGGSSGLATQIVEGAPVDVFAAASEATMTMITDAALADGAPTVFATNTLEIAVPAGNPAGITGLADFANPELSIALCAAEVPCGAASGTVFDAAGVVAAPDTLEQDVRAVLTRIELGEVDAGLVYTTDVRSAGAAVEGIGFSEASTAIGRYPIARLAASANKDAAAAFIAYVLSPAGRGILERAGFGAP
jgi:molybdate transport system substrate-binding protein